MDEQICEQKDSIEVMKREALSEANNLKEVIGSLGVRLQSTQNELQQAVQVESRMRDTMPAEMREANMRGSSSTLPEHSSTPPSIPVDFLAQVQDMMARESREIATMLGSQFEAFTDFAESRDRNLRDEMKLIKNEMNFGQEVIAHL